VDAIPQELGGDRVLNLLALAPGAYFNLLRDGLEGHKMWMAMLAFLVWGAALVWASTKDRESAP
jgi:hypothetical protein